jgi:hypothetical protein
MALKVELMQVKMLMQMPMQILVEELKKKLTLMLT